MPECTRVAVALMLMAGKTDQQVLGKYTLATVPNRVSHCQTNRHRPIAATGEKIVAAMLTVPDAVAKPVLHLVKSVFLRVPQPRHDTGKTDARHHAHAGPNNGGRGTSVQKAASTKERRVHEGAAEYPAD